MRGKFRPQREMIVSRMEGGAVRLVAAAVCGLAAAVLLVGGMREWGGGSRNTLLSPGAPGSGRTVRGQGMIRTQLVGAGGSGDEVGTPFHFTKWGPLRSKKWQSSRYRVLALWEAASRSLESCMDAENFVFPHAQDSNCHDVVRSFDGVRQCMRHQHDGLRGLASGSQGAWEALTSIVEETKALGTKDREMVAKKITRDAALYTLARLDALHARCSAAGWAKPPSREHAPLTFDPEDPLFQAERAVGYVRGQEPPKWQGRGEGEWPVKVDLSGLPREEPAYPVKGDGWDSIRRASRRGYIRANAEIKPAH